MSEKTPQIGKCIAAVMAAIPAIGKDGRNKEQNFTFRKLDDILDFLHPVFAANGVVMIPVVKNKTFEKGKTAKGTEYTNCIVDIEYRFTATDGSFISCEASGEARDYGDKSLSKACSMALKMALNQTFLIATHEVEADSETFTEGRDSASQVAFDDTTTIEQLESIRDAALRNNAAMPAGLLGRLSELKAQRESDNEQRQQEVKQPAQRAKAQKSQEAKSIEPKEANEAPESGAANVTTESVWDTVITVLETPTFFNKTIRKIYEDGKLDYLHQKWVVAKADKIKQLGGEAQKQANAVLFAIEELKNMK